MVESSQDRNPSRRRFQRKKRSSRGRSLRGEKRPEKKIRGFEAHGYRETYIKQYKAKEKADYQNKKTGERRMKKDGSVAPAGEVKYTVWADGYKGVDQKVVDKPTSDNECTRCGIKNHAMK